MIEWPSFRPDLGPYSGAGTNVATNVLRTANGVAPIAQLLALSIEALPGECKGAWLYRNNAGVFGFIAATQTNFYKLNSSKRWDIISRLSADQAVNGTFAADVSWTKGTNWTIAAGVATATASASGQTLSQAQSFTVGKQYKVTFTVTGYSAGGVRPRLTGGTTVNGTTRTANGTYTEYLTVVTGNNNFSFENVGSTTLNLDNVTVQMVDSYTGPSDGDLWQADMFGSLLIAVNINDPPQKFDVDSAAVFSNLGGSPPQAKYIETVGDFVFLSYLRISAVDYARRAQHSMLNNAENWTIDGLQGSSDQIECPDGDEIMGIFSCPGGARLIQRRCKRRLTFTPGAAVAFTMSDIDSMRGAIAPNAIVNIGGDRYLYINETGIYMGDAHEEIGQDQVDKTFLKDVDPDRLQFVQGINDATLKIAWFRYQDGSGNYQLLGYDWGHGEWLYSDAAVQLLVTAVSVGVSMDDITATMESYAGIPMDSRIFKGGRITPGAFQADNFLYLFAGSPMEATIEIATTELNPEGGSFVYGSKVKGDVPTYSVNVGKSMLPDSAIQWAGNAMRSSRTGMVPARVDGKFHRARITIPAGTIWTICHGISLFSNPSGGA